MINNFPFFRFPFYAYPRNYSRNYYSKANTFERNNDKIGPYYDSNNTESHKEENRTQFDRKKEKEKKSSKYNSIGPILINTDGFSNKEEPLIEFSGLKLYSDDLIILCLLFFLYKEDVKDDMLFILLILLLIS